MRTALPKQPPATRSHRPRAITVFAAAFVAGAAAAIGVNRALDVRLAQSKPRVESEAIFVALRSLPQGAPVTVWDVALRDWPKAMMPATALRACDTFSGKVLKHPLREGQPLLSIQLAAEPQESQPAAAPQAYPPPAAYTSVSSPAAPAADRDLWAPAEPAPAPKPLAATAAPQAVSTVTTPAVQADVSAPVAAPARDALAESAAIAATGDLSIGPSGLIGATGPQQETPPSEVAGTPEPTIASAVPQPAPATSQVAAQVASQPTAQPSAQPTPELTSESMAAAQAPLEDQASQGTPLSESASQAGEESVGRPTPIPTQSDGDAARTVATDAPGSTSAATAAETISAIESEPTQPAPVASSPATSASSPATSVEIPATSVEIPATSAETPTLADAPPSTVGQPVADAAAHPAVASVLTPTPVPTPARAPARPRPASARYLVIPERIAVQADASFAGRPEQPPAATSPSSAAPAAQAAARANAADVRPLPRTPDTNTDSSRSPKQQARGPQTTPTPRQGRQPTPTNGGKPSAPPRLGSTWFPNLSAGIDAMEGRVRRDPPAQQQPSTGSSPRPATPR